MRIGQVMVGVVAARLLVPEDFGLFAVTLVVYAIIVNISDFGVASAVIRTRLNIDDLGPTAVTLSLISGAMLGAVTYGAAPWIAAEFGAPAATEPIQIMSLVVLIAGLSAVPTALLTREFMQNRRFYADLTSFLISNGLLIVLAIEGHGVYALVWSRVAGQVVTVAVLLLVSPRRYRPGFQPAVAAQLVRFGLPMVGANLLGFAIGAVDVAVIGRQLGPVPLGSYSLANNVAAWPLQMFLPVLLSVGLPLVSRFTTDTTSLRRIVSALTAITACAILPVSALLVALAPELVQALYGSKWAAAGPVLAILGIYGAVRVMLALLADVLVACNAPRALLFVQLVWLVVLIPSVALGTRLGGLNGAAAAVAVAAAVGALPMSLILVHKHCHISALELSATLPRPLICSVISALAAWATSTAFSPAWLAVLAGGLIGVLVYITLMHRTLRHQHAQLRAVVHSAEHPSFDHATAHTL